MPLGKLSKRQIQAACSILSEVQQVVFQDSSDSQSLDVSNLWDEEALLLNTADSAQAEVQVLNNLLGVDVACSLLRGGSDDSRKGPIDVNYEKLKTDIKLVDKDLRKQRSSGSTLRTPRHPRTMPMTWKLWISLRQGAKGRANTTNPRSSFTIAGCCGTGPGPPTLLDSRPNV